MPPLLARYVQTCPSTTSSTSSSCQSPHRLIILIITICIGLAVGGIILFLWLRSRSRAAARSHGNSSMLYYRVPKSDEQATWLGTEGGSGGRYPYAGGRRFGERDMQRERDGEAPPPAYEESVKRPERVARGWGV